MMIDYDSFTPIASLLGGILIGLAACILLLFNGRIMGISGIVSQSFKGPVLQNWRLLFTLTVIATAIAYAAWSPTLPTVVVSDQKDVLIIGGLLVGFGTKLGAGCTSGHGICGLSRFSARSAIAVVTFMAVAIIAYGLINGFGG